MLKRYWKRAAAVMFVAAGLAMIAAPALKAAGLWFGLPGVGNASYCVTYAVYPLSATTPGTLSTSNQCTLTAPAGPTVFSGTEASPFDLFGPLASATSANTVPTSAYINLVQLGQGPVSITNPAALTAFTIPNNTPWFFLTSQESGSSAKTVTMPASAIEGQIQHVVCDGSTAGTVAIVANTNQTLRNAPSTADCTAGNAYAWRYTASSTTWYRIQ